MDPLTRRNTESVEQVLKDMTARLFEQSQRLDAMQRGLSALAERMNALERAWQVACVGAAGTGPTERR